MSLTSCGMTTSGSDTIIVAPQLLEYSEEVEARAAKELDRKDPETGMPAPPCPRVEVTPDCSAVKTFVNDYHWTRNRIRELEEDARR